MLSEAVIFNSSHSFSTKEKEKNEETENKSERGVYEREEKENTGIKIRSFKAGLPIECIVVT